MNNSEPTRRVAAFCTLLAAALSTPTPAAEQRPLVDPGSVSIRYATASIERDGEFEDSGPGMRSRLNTGPIRTTSVPTEGGGSEVIGLSWPTMRWSAITPEPGVTAEFEARYTAGAQSQRWGDAGFSPDIQEVRGAIALDVFEPVRVRIEAVAACTARGGASPNTPPELAASSSAAGGHWSASFEPADAGAESPCTMLIEGAAFVSTADGRHETHSAEAVYVRLQPGSYVVRTRITALAGGVGVYPETIAPAADTFVTLNLRVLSSCPADLDRDGDVDIQDLTRFTELWAAADPEADISGSAAPCDKRSALPDGRTDTADLSVYMNLWAAGGCAY